MSGGLGAGELDALYDAHKRSLFGLAWRLTGNSADAEDAVQETFLRALRGRGAYDERGRAAAWLTRILVNVVRERGRRAAHYRYRIEPDLVRRAGDGASGDASPEARAISAEAVAQALAALRVLPDPFREVLVLRQFEQRSTAEVAGLLEIPEATVRTRLKRARDALLRVCAAQPARTLPPAEPTPGAAFGDESDSPAVEAPGRGRDRRTTDANLR